MIYYFSVRRMVKRNMVTGTRRFDKPASLLPHCRSHFPPALLLSWTCSCSAAAMAAAR